MTLRKSIPGICLLVLGLFQNYGQKINLADQFKQGKITTVNRETSLFQGDEAAIEMDAKEGDGLAIVQNMQFEKGMVKLDIRGENNPGRSFVGFAFNIQNDSTYEAVYFRPFNFVAEEAIRKAHMVQYIHHPEYTWRKLRTERTGQFENEINSPPDPDNWFQATLHITGEKVSVYVNDEKEPSLVVSRLAKPESSTIGMWTGFNSSGRFKNLGLKSE
ncbi:MAG: hypothetical protein R3356_06690 [Eudoraea sp.]|nr:hypothetical protein [Eudoraea sp.]